MPFSNLLRSAAGTCQYCGNKAGIISRDHAKCQRAHQAGWNEMLEFAAGAARTHQFDEKTLRLALAEIARRSYTGTAPPSTGPWKRAGSSVWTTPWPTG